MKKIIHITIDEMIIMGGEDTWFRVPCPARYFKGGQTWMPVNPSDPDPHIASEFADFYTREVLPMIEKGMTLRIIMYSPYDEDEDERVADLYGSPT